MGVGCGERSGSYVSIEAQTGIWGRLTLLWARSTEDCQRTCGDDGKSVVSRQGGFIGRVGFVRADELTQSVVTTVAEQQRTRDRLSEFDAEAESMLAGCQLIVSSVNYKL